MAVGPPPLLIGTEPRRPNIKDLPRVRCDSQPLSTASCLPARKSALRLLAEVTLASDDKRMMSTNV